MTTDTVQQLKAKLQAAEARADREYKMRLEVTKLGERGELSGWAKRATDAEARAVEAEKRARIAETDGTMALERANIEFEIEVVAREDAEAKLQALTTLADKLRDRGEMAFREAEGRNMSDYEIGEWTGIANVTFQHASEIDKILKGCN